jgi:NAD(P)-dependent dehydrogenase (short-subunit alcohol dehydrogenase family)
MRFVGKTAIVTGAGSGLGREVARRLAGEGAARLLLLDRDAAGLADSVAACGGVAEGRVLDVADGAAWDALAVGTPDILVCAAGILGPAVPVAECSPEDWERVFAINVRGTYLAARRVVPAMRRPGAIVNFASTAGLAGSAVLGAYSASKGAVVMLTKSLALSLATQGVRVNCVCPGSIETPMLEQTFASAGDGAAQAARAEAYRLRHPMHRFGQAGEVAEAVLFLASDAAGFVTGVALPVDGGRLA